MEQEQTRMTWTCDNFLGLPIVDRLRRACPAEREKLGEFCHTATGKIATRLRVILDTMDGLPQTQIARASRLSQPVVRTLQQRYATYGPIGLLEGRWGWAGRRSSLSQRQQDRAVASSPRLAVRGLAREVQASKSATHRLVVKAAEIARVIGIGGGYVNPRHYLLVAGFAPRPESLQRRGHLRATYAELFATVSDNDWDVAGCERVVAYIVQKLHHVRWDGTLQIIADPRLAAVASRRDWLGGRDDISIQAGPTMRIWRFVLTELIGSRPPGWHIRAMRMLRSIDESSGLDRECREGITRYLTMMEWRADPSGWKSIEFLPDAHHLLQRSSAGLSRVLEHACAVRAADRNDSFKIYPVWDYYGW
jgi:hypothetical protein